MWLESKVFIKKKYLEAISVKQSNWAIRSHLLLKSWSEVAFLDINRQD